MECRLQSPDLLRARSSQFSNNPLTRIKRTCQYISRYLPFTRWILSQSVLNKINPLYGQNNTYDDKDPSAYPWEIFTQVRIFAEIDSLAHQRTDGNQW
jgi:hypothetical protein